MQIAFSAVSPRRMLSYFMRPNTQNILTSSSYYEAAGSDCVFNATCCCCQNCCWTTIYRSIFAVAAVSFSWLL